MKVTAPLSLQELQRAAPLRKLLEVQAVQQEAHLVMGLGNSKLSGEGQGVFAGSAQAERYVRTPWVKRKEKTTRTAKKKDRF